jgi:BNR repeat-containing family member
VVAGCLAGLLALAPTVASAQTRVLGPGGWSYFGDPRAVHAGGKTFVGYTGTDRYIHLAELQNGRVIRQRRLGPQGRRLDDHTNPSLYVLGDGRLRIFYSDHQGPRMYVRTTRDPYSLRSISGASALLANTSGGHGFSYPNPLRASSRLWLFFRGGNFQPNYRTYRDGRWSSVRTLAWGPRERLSDGSLYQHRPYTKYDTDGGSIHGAFTEGNEDRYRNSIYYARVSPSGLYTATGRRMARLGSAPSVRSLDKVRGAASKQWALDIAKDGSRPVIAYRRGTRPREYWYARHNGERWVNHKITSFTPRSKGQVGSITLDHERPNTVYLSRMGSRGKLEVEVWVTADRGATWARRAITRDSREDNFRPVTPRGLRDGEEVAWFAGDRTRYTDFNTDVIVRLLEAAERLAKEYGEKRGS